MSTLHVCTLNVRPDVTGKFIVSAIECKGFELEIGRLSVLCANRCPEALTQFEDLSKMVVAQFVKDMFGLPAGTKHIHIKEGELN